jgi:hypothetical protein
LISSQTNKIEKANRAVNILLRGKISLKDMIPSNTQTKISLPAELLDKRSWQVMMAWARLEQGRFRDSMEHIRNAMIFHHQIPDSEEEKNSTSAFCIYAELLSYPWVQKNIIIELEEHTKWLYGKPTHMLNKSKSRIFETLEKCAQTARFSDLDDDYWRTRVNNMFNDDEKR